MNPRAPSAARRRFLLRIAGSLLLLALLWAFFPTEQLRQGFARVEAKVFAATLAGFLLTHVLGALKWNFVLHGLRTGLGPLTAVRCYYLGLFGNLFLPSVIGGDLISVGAAFRHAPSRAGTVLGTLLNRGLDFAALLLLAVAGAAAYPGLAGVLARNVLWILAVLLAGALAAWLAAGWWVRRGRWSFRMRRRFVKARRLARLATGRPARALAVLLASAALQTVLAALAAWIGASCGLALPFHVWLYAWTLGKLAAFLPITQGGIGVREFAFAGILAPLGVAPGTAASVGLVWEAVIIGGGLCAGLIAFLLGRGAGAASPQPAGAPK